MLIAAANAAMEARAAETRLAEALVAAEDKAAEAREAERLVTVARSAANPSESNIRLAEARAAEARAAEALAVAEARMAEARAIEAREAERRATEAVAAPNAATYVQPGLTQTGATDAWKNKRIYLGGGLGGVRYSFYRDYYEKINGGEFAIGFFADFSLTNFFSIETVLGLGVGEFTIPALVLMAKLGGRFTKIELSADLGYAIGAGMTVGGTFGINTGPGILFVKLTALPAAPASSTGLDSIMLVSLGYKVGVVNKR